MGGGIGSSLKQRWYAYGVALGGVAAVVATLLLIDPYLDYHPYFLYLPAILVASTVGGMGPGLLGLACSLAAWLGFSGGLTDLSVSDPVGVTLFTIVGAWVAWWGGQVTRARTRAFRATEKSLALASDVS